MFLIKCVWILTQNNGCESYVVESLVWVKLELKEILFNRFCKKKKEIGQPNKKNKLMFKTRVIFLQNLSNSTLYLSSSSTVTKFIQIDFKYFKNTQ